MAKKDKEPKIKRIKIADQSKLVAMGKMVQERKARVRYYSLDYLYYEIF